MTTDLGLREEDAFGVEGARWTPTGLTLPVATTFEQWESVGYAAGRIRDMAGWALGDWLIFGEARWGEQYAQAFELTQRSYGGLRNLRSVAARIPQRERRASLSWSHHAAVASLAPVERKIWLDQAETNDWSVDELRENIREERSVTAPLHTRASHSAPRKARVGFEHSTVSGSHGGAGQTPSTRRTASRRAGPPWTSLWTAILEAMTSAEAAQTAADWTALVTNLDELVAAIGEARPHAIAMRDAADAG